MASATFFEVGMCQLFWVVFALGLGSSGPSASLPSLEAPKETGSRLVGHVNTSVHEGCNFATSSIYSYQEKCVNGEVVIEKTWDISFGTEGDDGNCDVISKSLSAVVHTGKTCDPKTFAKRSITDTAWQEWIAKCQEQKKKDINATGGKKQNPK